MVEVGNGPKFGLYSPDGKCEKFLIANNVGEYFGGITMALLDEKIVACGLSTSTSCYLYDISSNIWTLYSSSSKVHQGPGVVHQGKIWLPDDTQPEVFDPVSKAWANWAVAPTSSQNACFVSWKSYIIKFVGTNIEKYDPSKNTWSTISSSALFSMDLSGCVTLPNDNILIAGTVADLSKSRSHAEFNVTSNTWTPIITGNVDHYASVALLLGNRAFVVPTDADLKTPGHVEEYIYSNKTISSSVQPFRFNTNTNYPSVIAAPAKWFARLVNRCTGVF